MDWRITIEELQNNIDEYVRKLRDGYMFIIVDGNDIARGVLIDFNTHEDLLESDIPPR